MKILVIKDFEPEYKGEDFVFSLRATQILNSGLCDRIDFISTSRISGAIKSRFFSEILMVILFLIWSVKNLFSGEKVFIYCAFPSIGSLVLGFTYKAIKKSTFFLIDYRDQWPEIFKYHLRGSAWYRLADFFGIVALLRVCVHGCVRRSDHVMTVSEGFKSFLVNEVGVESSRVSWATSQDFKKILDKFHDKPRLVDGPVEFVYIGAVSEKLRFPKVNTEVCGDAPTIHFLGYKPERMPEGLDYLIVRASCHWYGFKSPAFLSVLNTKAPLVGLLNFENRDDFNWSFPNKFYIYIALSIPVICRSGSSIADFVELHNCGWTYNSDSDLSSLIFSDRVCKEYKEKLGGLKVAAQAISQWPTVVDVVSKLYLGYRNSEFLVKDNEIHS